MWKVHVTGTSAESMSRISRHMGSRTLRDPKHASGSEPAMEQYCELWRGLVHQMLMIMLDTKVPKGSLQDVIYIAEKISARLMVHSKVFGENCRTMHFSTWSLPMSNTSLVCTTSCTETIKERTCCG